MGERRPGADALVILASLFVAGLTASQFLAAKITQFSLPLVGSVVLPAGFLAYAATFLFTDIISEVYGRRAAGRVVAAGFASQVLVLGLSAAALRLPAAPYGAGQEAFAAVVGAAPSIVLASLAAYLASQVHDVWAFHWWRERTRGRWLWLRNNASTAVSQLIDTALFITLAFALLPRVLGGEPLPWGVVGNLILGQYAAKLLVAAADTPLVYLGVALVRGDSGLGLRVHWMGGGSRGAGSLQVQR